jgi:lipopolysaccharide transport system permease protein
MLPWQMFTHAVSESSNSLIANANMLSKVYFPRIVLPASAVLVSLADFLISFAMLAAIMAWYQFIPSWRIVTLPIFLLLALTLSLGFGTWLASLNVKYRDFRYIVPFLLQFGLYISPVGFSSSVVPDRWRLLYSLNPMVGVIDGFRWAIIGSDIPFYLPGFLLSIGLTFGVLYFGLTYFHRTECSFADLI